MPSSKIDTLVEDIYGVFDKDIEISPELSKDFGEKLASEVVKQVTEKRQPYLRLSNLGESCRRRLWFTINRPELAERLPGHARIKFLIGNITEAVILFLARLAGHDVADEQKEVSIDGVKGHLDCTIDGELTDVKSASPPSFKKFQAGLNAETDGFGYRTQLGTYGAADNHDRGHFLAVDKVSGVLHLDSHELETVDYEQKIAETRKMLSQPNPPPRDYSDEPWQDSGNRKLVNKCSYCEFKNTCWPGVQRYDMANGPVYLTVVKRPPVPRGKK